MENKRNTIERHFAAAKEGESRVVLLCGSPVTIHHNLSNWFPLDDWPMVAFTASPFPRRMTANVGSEHGEVRLWLERILGQGNVCAILVHAGRRVKSVGAFVIDQRFLEINWGDAR